MDKTHADAYHEITKKEFELEKKLSELKNAKDNYKDVLMEETIKNILTVQKEDGSLTERDLKIFLNDLTIRLKNLYSN